MPIVTGYLSSRKLLRLLEEGDLFQEEICLHLQTKGFGVTDIDIFSYSRDDPDEAITVRPYGSSRGGLRKLKLVTGDEVLRAQVRVRGRYDALTQQKAFTAWETLHAFHETIQGGFYLYLKALQTPYPMGRDHKNRAQYVFNLEARRKV